MSTARLPKQERVRKRAEFSRMMTEGVRVDGDVVQAFWSVTGPLLENDPRANRAGFAAGRRLGDAVRRNRLKRLLREAYRKNKDELSWMNLSIVFVARSRALRCTAQEIEREVVRLLRVISTSAPRCAPDSSASFPPIES